MGRFMISPQSVAKTVSSLLGFLLAAVFWFGLTPAMAGVLQLTDEPFVDLSTVWEVYLDESQTLTIDEVVALQNGFRPMQGADLVRRYDSRVYWLRMRLHNTTHFPMQRFLDIGHPRMESVKLHQRRGDAWSVMASGINVPNDQKKLQGSIVFPLHIAQGETQEWWMRVQSRTVLDLKSSLWNPLDHQQSEQNRRLLMVAGFGGSLVVTFISLAILFRSRELNFLLFASLHLFSGLAELGREGIWQEFFWPSALAFPIELHAVTGVAALGSLIVIQMRLLDLKVEYPRLSGLHLALAVILLAWMPIAWLNYEVWIRGMSVMVIGLGLLSIGIFVVLWGKGNEVAGYLFWGYLSFWSLEAIRSVAGLLKLDLEFTKNISVTWALLISTPLFFFALIEKSKKLHYEVAYMQELYRAKSLFLAKVSHELHSPLNTIIGYARMLSRKSDRLSVEEGAHDIERNGLRLLRMLNDLLDQSRIENSHLSLHPLPVSLGTWLAELQRIGMVMTEEAGNSFAFSTRGNMPSGALLDAPRLQQIIDNLITNANRHTHRGQVKLVVHAKPSSGNQKVNLTFSVEDNGEGISVEDQSKIFETFFQGKSGANSSKSERQGLGLGLTIANHILSLMGSSLNVRSVPGQGSHFSFSIDCETVDVQHLPLSEFSAAEPLQRVPKSYRVLVVDDETEVLNYLRDSLEFLDCKVTCFTQGNAAIAALSNGSHPWDLVITDQFMAQGNGWDVLQFARQNFPELPVVLVSGMLPERPAGMPAEIQFDAELRKPVDLKNLALVLASLMPNVNAHQAPDGQSLSRLLSLVRLGEVSAIEEWCDWLDRDSPEFAGFSLEVRDAVKRLDFHRLEQLAMR